MSPKWPPVSVSRPAVLRVCCTAATTGTGKGPAGAWRLQTSPRGDLRSLRHSLLVMLSCCYAALQQDRYMEQGQRVQGAADECIKGAAQGLHVHLLQPCLGVLGRWAQQVSACRLVHALLQVTLVVWGRRTSA